MTKTQRDSFVKMIKQGFSVEIEFYPKDNKTYGLVFLNETDKAINVYFGETDHPIPWQTDHLNCWRTDAANAVEACTKIVI